MQQTKRQTAYKVWIGSLINSDPVLDNERFNFLKVANKTIARVNLIANVIDKYNSENPDKQYTVLTLDDASGQFRVKTFGNDTAMLKDINIGDTITAIGWLRYYNNELYIIPEIIRSIDTKWALVRKLELTAEYGDLTKQQTQQAETINIAEQKELLQTDEGVKEINDEIAIRDSIFKLVKQSDEGIDVDKLIMQMKYPIDKINSSITTLLEEGEIYEPQPGRLRSMN